MVSPSADGPAAGGADALGTATTARGAATRGRLLQAARDVVAEVGYPHATTRAIAEAAGVAEGTIYRHFPDKATLFLAAVVDANAPVLVGLSGLPARAGHGSVIENLADALGQLAQLRAHMLPLELAMLTDPELAAQRQRALAAHAGTAGAATGPAALPGPPQLLAQYLAAEQALGRIRADLDPVLTAVTILAALFGLALVPGAGPGPGPVDGGMLRHAVEVLCRGLLP
jgi:AcrR family transcriptional regulator